MKDVEILVRNKRSVPANKHVQFWILYRLERWFVIVHQILSLMKEEIVRLSDEMFQHVKETHNVPMTVSAEMEIAFKPVEQLIAV